MTHHHRVTAIAAAIIVSVLMLANLAWAQAPDADVLEPTGDNEFDVIAKVTAEPNWTANARFQVKINDQIVPSQAYPILFSCDQLQDSGVHQ